MERWFPPDLRWENMVITIPGVQYPHWDPLRNKFNANYDRCYRKISSHYIDLCTIVFAGRFNLCVDRIHK